MKKFLGMFFRAITILAAIVGFGGLIYSISKYGILCSPPIGLDPIADISPWAIFLFPVAFLISEVLRPTPFGKQEKGSIT